jgi:hypothetical protein
MSDAPSTYWEDSGAQTRLALRILSGLTVVATLLVPTYAAFSGLPYPGRFAFLGSSPAWRLWVRAPRSVFFSASRLRGQSPNRTAAGTASSDGMRTAPPSSRSPTGW